MMVYPMRDISAEEIDLLGRNLGLSWVNQDASFDKAESLATDKHNINSLAALFVQNVLAHNPGAVHNINSTISRLEAFPWNESQPGDAAVERKKDETSNGASIDVAAVSGISQPAPEVLCPLCSAPLADDEVVSAASESRGALAGVCDSCLNQEFGGAVDGGELLALLPRGLGEDIANAAAAWGKARDVAGGEALTAEDLRRHFDRVCR